MLTLSEETAPLCVSEVGYADGMDATLNSTDMLRRRHVVHNHRHSDSSEFASAKSHISPHDHDKNSFMLGPGEYMDPSNEEYYYSPNTFLPTSWLTFSTAESSGVWLNTQDPPGLLMSSLVWFLFLYSAVIFIFLAESGGISGIWSLGYCILVGLALACHAKTLLTDPGSVPKFAASLTETTQTRQSYCTRCSSFKPPSSHHCRICSRCISGMDHHCPWMNNCIGRGNMKHFLLFLLYCWSCSVYSLTIIAWNYFFCEDEACEFDLMLKQLVRCMMVLCIVFFLFTSSMLMNVIYGLITGIGTIDRMKKKSSNTFHLSEEEQIPLVDVFGIGSKILWLLPTDPVFEDHGRVLGFVTRNINEGGLTYS